MNRLSIFATALLAAGACFTAGAQTQSLEVKSGNVRYCFNATQAGLMTYTDGSTLTIQGRAFALADVEQIAVTDNDIADNTVFINYSGDTADVSVAGNVARYIDVSITDADVQITQSDLLSADEGGEITYILSGESANGSFSMKGSYKATLELHGLSLTSGAQAALNIQNGKRISLKPAEGTVNTITDGEGGKQKGAIVCTGHLEIKGKGALTVAGHTSHAIYAKEYVTLKNASVTVTSAVKDGLNCAQYFEMESGSLTISGTADDGIQCSYKDDTDREAEDTGTIFIKGGKLDISITATAAKALKADGDFVMTGGEIKALTSGGGLWDDSKQKTKASSCVSTDGIVNISGGSLDLTATGSGGKGISSDGELTISDGQITIHTSGGMYAYVNGQEYDNYTGNTDRLNSDAKSSPKGIKSDSNVLISGGEINITTTGNGGEGIESKAVLTIEGGEIIIRSYDDSINSKSHMYIKGGEIEVIAKNNDGLDANGNMYISGGVIRAFGANSPECGIDVNEEEGYTLYITGGYILGAGGNNSVPSKAASTQAYVIASTTPTAGGTVSIGTSAETYYSFAIPADYSTSGSGFFAPGGNRGQSLLISTPELVSGQSYTITSGTASTTATARLTGGSTGWGH